MATELAHAYVTIIPSLKGASKTIQKELGGVNLTSTGNSWGKSLTSGMTSGLVKVGKIGVGAIASIGAAVSGLAISGGISRALKIEQAEYKLSAMGLNVESVMQSCNEAVTGTAYGLDAAATVASSLGASGVQAGEQMTNALKGVAGMAAMSGRSMEDIGLIFGKVAAQGKLQGDELTQFAESGVNATAALANYLGKTQAEVRELVKDGVIDFKTFSEAMYATFGEAAQGANNTFTGAMSNVRAALSRIGAKFATPALKGLTKVFAALIPAINAISATLDPLVEKFTAFVEAVSGKAVTGIEAFTEALTETGSYMSAFKAVLSSVFGGSALGKSFEIVQLKAYGWVEALKAGVSPLQLIRVELEKLASKGANALSVIGERLKTAFDGTFIEIWVLKIEGWIAALKAGWSPLSLLQVELGKLNGTVAEFFGKINAGGAVAAGVFAGFLAKFGAPLSAVVAKVVDFGAKVAGVFSKLGGFAGIIATIGMKLNTLGSAIALCGGGVKGLAVILGSGLRTALAGILTPVNLIVMGIAALAAAFAYLMTTNEGFREQIMGLVATIGSNLAPIIAIIAATVGNFASTVLPIVTNLIASLVPILGQIITILLQVVAAVSPILTILAGIAVPLVSKIIQLVVMAAANIISAVLPAISTILSVIQAALPFIQAIFETVMAVIVALVESDWPAIQSIVTKAIEAVKGVVNSALNVIKGVWNNIWGWVKSFINSTWNSVKSTVSSGVSNVVSFVSQIPSKVKSLFSNAKDWLVSAGKNILQGLWNGISNSVSWLLGKVSSIGGQIVSAAKRALGIHSPSKLFSKEVGFWIPAGIGVGIEKNVGSALRAMQGVNDALYNESARLAPFDDVSASISTYRSVDFGEASFVRDYDSFAAAVASALEKAEITAKTYINGNKLVSETASESDRYSGMRQIIADRGVALC